MNIRISWDCSNQRDTDIVEWMEPKNDRKHYLFINSVGRRNDLLFYCERLVNIGNFWAEK